MTPWGRSSLVGDMSINYESSGSLLGIDGPQCDQMGRLFFHFRPFTSLRICPMTYKICQSGSQRMPNTSYTVKKLPISCKILPKWWNFAKSGHTTGPSPASFPLIFCIFQTVKSLLPIEQCSVQKSLPSSVTSKKSPNVYKCCPKMISLEKW